MNFNARCTAAPLHNLDAPDEAFDSPGAPGAADNYSGSVSDGTENDSYDVYFKVNVRGL